MSVIKQCLIQRRSFFFFPKAGVCSAHSPPGGVVGVLGVQSLWWLTVWLKEHLSRDGPCTVGDGVVAFVWSD